MKTQPMEFTPEQVDAAIALIERGWCQGAVARDATGRCVIPGDPGAVAWCVMGACNHAGGRGYKDELVDAINAAFPGTDAQQLARWNDTPGRTREEVVAALRELRRTAVQLGGGGTG